MVKIRFMDDKLKNSITFITTFDDLKEKPPLLLIYTKGFC